jgi:hypothetical protein
MFIGCQVGGKPQDRDKPEFLGYIRSVAAAGEADPSLDIVIQSSKATEVVTLRTKDLATNAMFPKNDSLLWNYLPSWFFDEKLAEEAINHILKNDMFVYSTRFQADSETDIVEEFRYNSATLEIQFKKGFLGRYTCRMFESPKTKDGIDVYKLVVDSCTVSKTAIFVIFVFQHFFTLLIMIMSKSCS